MVLGIPATVGAGNKCIFELGIFCHLNVAAIGKTLARRTLAITWPQGVLGDDDSHAVAAQVHGGVREWQGRLVQEAVTPSQ